MRMKTSIPVMALVATMMAAVPSIAQVKLPQASPKASLTETVGLTDVTIVYSRPGVKGRTIWGGLVPYDQVWRTGANDATTIQFSDDVTIDGKKLAAGTYSLHTIPGKESWTIIFNTVSKQWGSFSYEKDKDALRVTAKPEKAEFTEWLQFDFTHLTADSARVEIHWENLSVPFTIGTDATTRALAGLRAALATAKEDDWRTPFVAARYASQNNLASDEASKWLAQSLKAQENINNLWLKAQMQAKAGDKAGAIKTAEAAIAKAGPQDGPEIPEIQKDIATWKK